MSKEVLEIQKILEEKSNEKVKASFQKFIPTSQRVYGVKTQELNKIVAKYKNVSFELVKELWDAGAFEERILAAKVLGKICKKDPEKTLQLIKTFSKDIHDWAVCDTLATQGIRNIKQKEILEMSKRLVRSKNLWKRRFAIVLLINFAKDRKLKKEIADIIKSVETDKEYYVKKAVEWIKRKL
jgi:3-methyladenine DNA glycosylase AlkD